MKTLTLCLTLTWCLLFASPSLSAEPPLPFQPGEDLLYDISWMGVVAGEGRLRVGEIEELNGAFVYPLSISSRSIGWVDNVYKVRDKTISFFDRDKRHSHRGEIHISEGQYRKTKIITFDQTNHKVSYKINDREPDEFDIVPDCQDPLSTLFILRTKRKEISAGEAVFIPVFDDKKMYEIEIRVVKKEQISLPFGMVNTILVQAFLKSEGIFQRKGKLWIWLSDDDQLTPVRIRSKVLVGSFYANLREYKNVHIDYIPHPKKDDKKSGK